ncbi:MAG TPA: leucine-rich repeat protein [Candidatus Aphodovivens avistercoris]|nr:leucine-rich repeat protein [Candidatus Aphodovivens avistercoris]
MSYTEQVDLSVLLQNTEKPALSYPDRRAAAAVDVSKLDVCFGGFTPMALSDGTASSKQVEQAQERVRARRESLERAAAIEAARASDAREHVDAAGNRWRYVVLDGTTVRVERCEPAGIELAIPDAIEGLPVVALAADALAYLPEVEVVSCPDSIVSVGFCAFRECKSLRTLLLPAGAADFQSDWYRNCRALKNLRLPGRLAKLEASIFDVAGLECLFIGAGACDIAPGAFAKSRLLSVEVDADNPFLMTDGAALYSADGSVLAALAVPCEEYAVRAGCRAVAKKGFSGFAGLRHVALPESLEVLGAFAFAGTAVDEFTAPAALREIREKAFFNCSRLKRVTLNAGLRAVEANAFSGTSLEELVLPVSVEEIGCPLAAGTGLVYAGPEATFRIEEGSEHLSLDGAGGLYERGPEGLAFVRLMDPAATRYAVRAGTVAIADEAFLGHAALAEMELPEGLRRIGARAFKACRKLSRINLPDALEEVGDEAFLDTALESVALPAGLARLGANALVTYGAHHSENPSLSAVEVAPSNERFYLDGSLLLERKATGAARVLLCTGGAAEVEIPSEVDEIAPYAFNGVRGIERLRLSDKIGTVGMRGLAVDGLVGCIEVDLQVPIAGHERFELRFPDTDRSAQQQMLALSVPNHVDVASLFEHYDSAIVNASSFDPEHVARLDLYEQSVRLVARLKDPMFLTPVNRSLCERVLTLNIGDVCAEAAKHDDRRLLDDLMDGGYVNEDNIGAMIERVGAVQDASMTGYLLEAKRLRFGREAFDFDL